MLAKVACLVTSLVSYSLCVSPPSSSKSVDPKKEQTFIHESKLLTAYANKFHIIVNSIAAIEVALYILLMSNGEASGSILKGSSSLPMQNQAMFQEMAELKTWQTVATVLSVLGYALRKWSFVTLDRFFTYQLTIRTGHKLVQSGPYTYLRHPSYTGAILNGICFHLLVFHQGLWDVFAILASHALSTIFQGKIAIPTSFLGIQAEYWMMFTYWWIVFYSVAKRVKTEEKMLKDHFGNEWDVYASKRWRFIPFVY
ncbi:hypothetical protein FBU30_004184 [Linnemannia zychae]|nr:hypothetical protein FBU30_004184 [Linnemannia zychae]